MEKRDALSMLQTAKSAHVQWRARAQALVAGIPLEKEQVPVAYTDCKFGKWYYGLGQQLSVLDTYRAIEEPHQQLHLLYMKIFKHLFGEDERSVLKKMFGSKRKHRAASLAEAQSLLPQLVNISETLLEAVDILENQIRRMPDDEFADLAGADHGYRVDVQSAGLHEHHTH
ncbi:MAG: CZB domain-containing protein [Chromatiaceae bacterium]|jgi:hypothetical protein|nr:CZB domain-containing protein [Chromatiaceae bacterium]